MSVDDVRWMMAAVALARRGVGRTAPNPSVGCILVRDGIVVGRGWTQPGGRPHAEQMALATAGDAARGATAYATLEPCAHRSHRGPSCADGLIAAGVTRVVSALADPDPRTAGQGVNGLRAAGIAVCEGPGAFEARKVVAGFLSRLTRQRPRVTLKLALSIDGRIALASGESRWITGDAARAHAHMLRAQSDMILVGAGTLAADDPALDVRLPGLEERSPRPAVLSSGLRTLPPGSRLAQRGALLLPSVAAALAVDGVNDLLVEGGAAVAASFLKADAVDRIMVYRAPLVIGDGRPGIADIGLGALSDAHGRWQQAGSQALGSDRLEVYERSA